MKKITDRFWLGVVSGLGGNIAKMAVERICINRNLSKKTGAKTAAGIFLKKDDLNKPLGRAVGIIADNMIAAGLGVTCAYWLTLMGKEKWPLKGAALGAAEWAGLYGVMSKMGASSIYPLKAKDALCSFVSHLVFGATKMGISVTLGDDRLFTPGNLTQKIDDPQPLKLISNKDENSKEIEKNYQKYRLVR